MTDPRRKELFELMAAMREGIIDADGIARIETLTRESSALRRFYIEHTRLSADLRLSHDIHLVEQTLARALQDQVGSEPTPAPLAPSRPASGGVTGSDFSDERFSNGQNLIARMPGLAAILLIAVPAIFLGALIARQLWYADSMPRVATARMPLATESGSLSPLVREPRPYVAQLTQAVDCVWAKSEQATRLGLPIRSGRRLALQEGLIEISFFDGARLAAHGPTVLELKSSDSAVLVSGEVRVRADVNAVGFTLLTSRVAVVDMGTEFGVRVDDAGRAQVDVFEGQVLAQVMGPAGTVRENIPIAEGRAVRFDQKAHAVSSHLADSPYVVDLAELPGGYQRWRAYSDSLACDPDLVAYYTFEDQQSGDLRLQNHSLQGSLLDGHVVHAQWAQGRWPDKGALEFRSRDDRVLIDLPGEFDVLSLATWVRLDESARTPDSLLHSDGHVWDNPGVIHWMVHPQQQTLFAFVDADKRLANCYSGVVIQTNESTQWHHFVVVFDKTLGTVTHYFDGSMASGQSIERPRSLQIGNAQIGNSSIENPQDDRHLTGLMDELMIFQRALSAAEVRYMHTMGRPDD